MGLFSCLPGEEEFTHDHHNIPPAIDVLLAEFFREIVAFLVECVDDGSIVSTCAVGRVEGKDLAVGQQRLILYRVNVASVDSETFLNLLREDLELCVEDVRSLVYESLNRVCHLSGGFGTLPIKEAFNAEQV